MVSNDAKEWTFTETFTPTVSSSCERLLSAIASECDLDLSF